MTSVATAVIFTASLLLASVTAGRAQFAWMRMNTAYSGRSLSGD